MVQAKGLWIWGNLHFLIKVCYLKTASELKRFFSEWGFIQCSIFKTPWDLKFCCLQFHALFLHVSVKLLKCAIGKWWLPVSGFSQRWNVVGARNMGCFVGQEATEGTVRHTCFRTRHLLGNRLNDQEFKESLVWHWHSGILSHLQCKWR